MPFGPILLDLQGFYQSPLNKTKWKSFVQIVRAMIYLSIIVSACVIFLRLPLVSRSVPLLFILIATLVLLFKERIIVDRIRRKAPAGRVARAGALGWHSRGYRGAGTLASRRSSTCSWTSSARIDIEKQPLSDLVEAMHRHAVARVIFAAGHSQLNRVEEAIGACEVEGVPAWVVADFIRTSIAKPDFDAFGGRPMLVFRSTPDVSWALSIKGIDRSGGRACRACLFAIPMLDRGAR